MEFVRVRWRGRWRLPSSTATVFTLLYFSSCFFCLCALLTVVAEETGGSKETGSPMQPETTSRAAAHEGPRRRCTVAAVRRHLVGPGSYPPRCVSKCGDCNPCKPVHEPFPPSTPVITEYYPEAWRCKCGGKIYMP